MNIISLLASVEAPGGLWSILINTFHGTIGNFGWTIFILTLTVKLVISPLDFWTKLNSKKQSLVQQKCAPQIAKIQKKFGANQEAVRTQTNALYKREGLNMGVGCLVTLINLVLTLVIFFTFYGSLRTNSAYQAINQYEILETTFNDTVYSELISKNDEITEFDITDNSSAEEFLIAWNRGYTLATSENTDGENGGNVEQTENTDQETGSEEYPLTDEEYIEIYNKYNSLIDEVRNSASSAVLSKWDEIKSDWLWIENIWVSDAPRSPFLTYDGLVSIARNGGDEYSNYVAENIDENNFTTISNLINSQGGRENNGYFILAVLAGGITFLSQFLVEAHNKLKNKKAKQLATESMAASMNSSMKIMKYIMPVIMILFVLQSSASFGIYIVASNISSIAYGEISNLIINRITRKQQKEVEEVLEKEANRLIKKGKLQERK